MDARGFLVYSKRKVLHCLGAFMKSLKIIDFLQKHGMASEGISLFSCTEAFLSAMDAGLQGAPSSLYMIPTYLSGIAAAPRNQKVIVMDAGGTNFRIAVYAFDAEGMGRIEGFRKFPMPGTEGELTKDQFFDSIADSLTEYAAESDRVGFCFSYAAEITPQKDGRILEFSKEVRVSGAEGSLIGEELNKALKKHGIPPKKFAVLNDTAATMLWGMGQPCTDFGGYVGFILGTGTNTCYMERAAAIGKIGGGQGTMGVNLESGCYAGFPKGTFDRALDRASQNPGDHQAEKMMAGAYLGELLTRTALGAAAEGLLSEPCGKALAQAAGTADGETLQPLKAFTMAEIGAFLEGEGPLCSIFAEPEDRAVFTALADDCFERAARMTAVIFAAILTKTGEGKDPKRPVCIAAEGTTFFKAKLFRPKLERYLNEFLRDTLGLHCTVVKAEDATLVGAAIAAL